MARVKINNDVKKEIVNLEEAKDAQYRGQPMKWQPMGQEYILVWGRLTYEISGPADDAIADGFKEYSKVRRNYDGSVVVRFSLF